MTDTKVFNLYTLLIICGVPLIINPFSMDAYSHPKIIFVYALSGILILYYLLKIRSRDIKTDLEEYALLGYVALVTISTIFSVNIYQSVVGAPDREEGFAAICCYILIYFIVSRYYKFSQKHLKYVVISAFIISIYGICQYYKLDLLQINPEYLETVATIGHRNFVGSYITLILPISIFAFVYSNKYVYLALSAALYLCMLCAYTRSSWLAFSFYICLLFYFVYKYKFKISRLVKLLLVFFCITVVFNISNNNETLNRMMTIKNDAGLIINNSPQKGDAGSNRFFIWERGFKLVKDKPLLGTGPDTFGIIFMDKYIKDVANPKNGFITIEKDIEGHVKKINLVQIDKAHNEYLQIAATMGVPSLLCYFLFIVGIISRLKSSIKNNIFIIPIFCSILGYLIQAFFNISVVGVAPVYWAIIGIAKNFSNNSNELN